MSVGYNDIKNIAAEAAANYINRELPLNDSLIKIAQERELNPEQIKRAVEATNQVTYLSLLKSASDRTLEFPVADYKEVIHSIVGPDDPGVEKSASVKRFQSNDPMDVFKDKSDGLEKKAFDINEVSVDNFPEQEKVSLLWGEFQRSQSELTKLAYYGEGVSQELSTLGSQFNKDPNCLVKLSHVAEDETDYNVLASFLGHDNGLEKVAESYEVFRDNDLNEARKFYDMYKEARYTYQKKKDLEDKMNKAASILGKFSDTVGKVGRSAAEFPGGVLGGAAGRVAGAGLGVATVAPYMASKHGVKTVAKGFGKDKLFKGSDLLGPIGLQSNDSVWKSLHKG